MLPSFCKETITRIRPGTRTLRGSDVPDWSADKVSTLVIGGCSVQPATTSLSMDGRVLGITDQLTAYLPENADVMAGDRIVYNGETYTINGDVKRWKGAANLSHIQLNLAKWEG